MYLGEITVPQTDQWVAGLRYRPEPPIAVRGSLDPWNQERKREQWLAEEAAWKQILPLQREYLTAEQEFNSVMVRYNSLIGELEGLTGQSGLIRVKGPIGMVISPINMVVGLLDKLTFGIFGGSKKKKKIQRLTQELERAQSRLTILQAVLERVGGAINQLVHAGKAVQEAQRVRMALDMMKSQEMYVQARGVQKQAAQEHARRALAYESLYPNASRQKGYDGI